MKKSVFPLIVTLVISCSVASAHRGSRSFGLGNATTPTFADYDADADGLISAEEIAAVKLAAAEAKAAAKAAAAEAKAAEKAAEAAAALAAFDANEDGVLDETEAAAAEAAADAAEAEAKAAAKAEAEAALLAAFDANEDGFLDIVEQAHAAAAASIADAEETLATLGARFGQIDTDADGQLTLAELEFALPLVSVERLYNTIVSYDTDLSLTISLAEFTSKPVSNKHGRGHKSKGSKRGRGHGHRR